MQPTTILRKNTIGVLLMVIMIHWWWLFVKFSFKMSIFDDFAQRLLYLVWITSYKKRRSLRFLFLQQLIDIMVSNNSRRDINRTYFGLSFFAFPNWSWKTTPSVKKSLQKGQCKGQLLGHKIVEFATPKNFSIFN